MRRFLAKLFNRIRQINKARTPQRGPRRAFLRIEGLEARELMSASPLTGLAATSAPAAHAIIILDPIQAKYQSLGGRNGYLGPALSGEMPTPYGGGVYEEFAGGDIFYSPATGAHVFSGFSVSEWERTANERGGNGQVVQQILGLPTADEAPAPKVQGAYVTPFQGGAIYYSTVTNQAHVVYGAIGAEYAATAHEVGGNGEIVQSILGAPTSDEINVPGRIGAREETFQGGVIYWSPATGAHVLYGAIGAKYQSTGGPLANGLPITDEANAAHVAGERVSFFQGDRAIYWTATTGAHVVYGAIEDKYLRLDNERDFFGRDVKTLLGAPTSDEMPVPGVAGALMVTFQGGTIYWSQATGAHVVYGAIGEKYASIGGPSSILGLPTSDEQQFGNGRISHFQHGEIIWTPTGGARVIVFLRPLLASA
jgi:uncharacterized protein with LGFP repeats